MKDPAFLFYPNDWLGGTLGMSFEEKGAFMDLLVLQFNRGKFTEKQALSYLKSESLWDVIKSQFINDDGYYWNKRLQEEKEKRKAYTESRRKSKLKSNEDDVRIYIVRDNVRNIYKIGSSVNPLRRYNELSGQKNPAIMMDENPDNRDITLLWYSDPVKRVEETVLHDYFAEKLISGEWYKLSNQNLEYVFNKYKGTYYERTLDRTENENEIEIKDVIKNITLEEFKKEAKALCSKNNYIYDDMAIEGKFLAWQSDRWKDGFGKPIKNWKSKLMNTMPHILKKQTVTPSVQRMEPM